MYQNHHCPSWNSPTQPKSSQLSLRLLAVEGQQNASKLSTQEQTEKEAFGQDKLETSQLQLKSESGTLAPAEQQQLGVLQAKMKDSWVQRREKASQFGHNIANIPISSTEVLQRRADQKRRPNRTGLPDTLKTGMEIYSGHSMDNVRVFYNSDKPVQIQAHAYAQGNNIYIAPGQKRHLKHEAGHVLDKEVKKDSEHTFYMNGHKINNNPQSEKKADSLGAKAMKLGQMSHNGEIAQRFRLPERVEVVQEKENNKIIQCGGMLSKEAQPPRVSLKLVGKDHEAGKSYALVTAEAKLTDPSQRVHYEIKWDATVVPGGNHLGQQEGVASDWIEDLSPNGLSVGDRNSPEAKYFDDQHHVDPNGLIFSFNDGIEQSELNHGSWWFRLRVVNANGAELASTIKKVDWNH